MGQRLAIAAALAVFLFFDGTTATRSQLSPVDRRAADKAKKDFEGALGQKAREVCSRALGVKVPAKTAQDVGRAYGLEKSIAWMECVVDKMYPAN